MGQATNPPRAPLLPRLFLTLAGSAYFTGVMGPMYFLATTTSSK